MIYGAEATTATDLLSGRKVVICKLESGRTLNCTAPTSLVTSTPAPACSYVRITGAACSPPPPLRTTHSGELQAANPGGSLRRLPWCGAKSTSQSYGASAITSSIPGDSKSPGSRIRRPAYSTPSVTLFALSLPTTPFRGGCKTCTVTSGPTCNRSPDQISRIGTPAR